MAEGGALVEPGCIFCRIAAGEVPCHKLYEDERVVAFLDAGPLSPGHALVVPRAHYRTLDRMPGELAGACLAVVPALARAILSVTGAEAFNVLQNNGRTASQVVDHAHLHVIPRVPGAGLSFDWQAGKLDEQQARDLRTKVTAALERE